MYKSKKVLLHIVEPGRDGEAPMLTEEIGAITEFMSKMENDDRLETKWGISYDPSLGKKIKVTIHANKNIIK